MLSKISKMLRMLPSFTENLLSFIRIFSVRTVFGLLVCIQGEMDSLMISEVFTLVGMSLMRPIFSILSLEINASSPESTKSLALSLFGSVIVAQPKDLGFISVAPSLREFIVFAITNGFGSWIFSGNLF